MSSVESMEHPLKNLQKEYVSRIKTILLSGNSIEIKRQEVSDYFNQTFTLYDNLFTTINDEHAFYLTADPLRHPLIFYYGHTAVFFINKLILMKLIEKRINPQYESLFAVGVDEMSWDDLNTSHANWPSVEAVKKYRDQVRLTVSQFINNMPLTLPITQFDPAWIVLMGIEHERIHLETSSVLIRQLPIKDVRVTPNWLPCAIANIAPMNQLLAVKGKTVVLGKQDDANTYGWDNEYGHFEVYVDDFYASKYLVSNHEFLSFIKAQGYNQPEHWTEEGWQWREYTKANMPRFWVKHKNDYLLRLMNTEIPMPWDWPVEVNHHESKAFCHWLGLQLNKKIRLPTEAEWYVLASQLKETYPNWQTPIGNIDLAYYASPCPVNYFNQGEFYDVVGNVWQWTDTTINSFPGFRVHPAYDDFSIPTFDEKHNLIKGGSWISTGNEATLQSRYAFRRHFYQHAGFRYVESDQKPYVNNNHYETDKYLSEYLEFHFGESYFNIPNFCKTIAKLSLKYIDKNRCLKAMDLGCAVGRTAFELCHHFDEVYGIDFSTQFINAALQLQRNHQVQYTIPIEGEIYDYRTCSLENIGVTTERAHNIRFHQGDACNLKSTLNNFDLIIAANLIDRLYDPLVFLQNIHERLVINGILLISSPYTWLLEYTKKDKWLGGIKIDGENVTTLSRLQSILEVHFILVCEPVDVPFVIRETQRKFQHTIAEVTIWKRVR